MGKVKVEDFNGTYACVICTESVRGGDALHCAQCSSNPVHVSCVVGSRFAETCSARARPCSLGDAKCAAPQVPRLNSCATMIAAARTVECS